MSTNCDSADSEKPPTGVESSSHNTGSPLLVGIDPFAYLRRFEWFIDQYGVELHYLKPVDGVTGHTSSIDGREFVNFSSYNYLGCSGDARVSNAAKAAIEQYGTSVSASRLVAGEKPVHGELEAALSSWIGTEDCLVFVSGHSTNVTSLGCLLGPQDLILYDVLSHNSLQQGIRLSGSQAVPFPHNNAQAVDALLKRQRSRYERVLIVTEGVFSMDGDIAPVPELLEVKRRHDAFLMVDEAHSMGVIGRTGRGVVEHFGLDPADIELWMGTLSKTFASCGGYIAGTRELISSLKYAAPGFVYSCGITPPNAAAALQSLRLLAEEPERVTRLMENADLFRELATAAGLDIGMSSGTAVVPVVLGSSILSCVVAHRLYERGVLVHPLFYPIVPERSARLRFFMTAMHTPEQIKRTIEAVTESVAEAQALFDSLPPETAQQLLQAASFDRP